MQHLLVGVVTMSLPSLPSLDQDLLSSHSFSAAANWLIPGRVLLGANPTKGRGSALDRIIEIRQSGGCNTFVSLQAELPPMDSANCPDSYADDARAVADPAPHFLHCPIEDLRPADDLPWLAKTVDDLAERVRQGEVLYIHCFAGRGRTGLVAACLLGVLYPGMQAEEALERVSLYYQTRATFAMNARAQDGMSPETEPQRQQVRDFFAARQAWLDS